MWQISPAAAAMLRSSHQVQYRATAITAVQGSVELPVLTAGDVKTDAGSQVRRSGSATFADPRLFPEDVYEALSPIGSELFLEYGISVPGGVEWVPLMTGPIQKVGAKSPPDAITVDVAGRSRRIAEDRFPAPTQTIDGATIVSEITRLITETMPTAVVLDQTNGNTQVAPQLDMDAERWRDGIEKLAAAASLEVFDDPLGRFVLRPVPTLNDPPVWDVDQGEGGVLISADLELTREQVYNGVVARGQRSDGTPSVYAMVVDDDASSPTRWGGPFGKRLRFYTSSLLTTVEQCQAAAQSMLEKVKGYAATVTLTTITNPALDAGDVIRVRLLDGTQQLHILDNVPVPMDVSSPQQLTTRSVDLPAEQ